MWCNDKSSDSAWWTTRGHRTTRQLEIKQQMAQITFVLWPVGLLTQEIQRWKDGAASQHRRNLWTQLIGFEAAQLRSLMAPLLTSWVSSQQGWCSTCSTLNHHSRDWSADWPRAGGPRHIVLGSQLMDSIFCGFCEPFPPFDWINSPCFWGTGLRFKET